MTVKIFLMAYQYVEMLKLNLECLKIMSQISNENIVIIDMGIDREIKGWLEGQKEFDYICAEGLENYARILNTAISEFSAMEDILLLNSNLICLGNCVHQLEEICDEDQHIGAVVPMDFAAVCSEKMEIAKALEFILNRENGNERSQIIKIPYQCVYITRRFINSIGQFDEEMLLPGNIMLDYSFRGNCEKWRYVLASNAFVYEGVPYADVYASFLGMDVDRERLKEKWNMNYFNEFPNHNLINEIMREKDEAFTVLEVGCDCGVNLMQIQNEFPRAKRYGLEINTSAAKIASNFGEIISGNIEDYCLPYKEQFFDYILFGDVLEHLRDPENAVNYIRRFLKPCGKIVASIPNLMNYTVLRHLICGNFTYQDTGLLDKTHIHFFTGNEIERMFSRAGYRIEKCSFTLIPNMSEEDKKFVAIMKNIGNCEEYAYIAYQYLVVVSAEKASDMENFLPRFRSDEETIRLIVEEKKSLGRFGNGEFAIAFDIPRQKIQRTDPKLRERIRQVLTQKDNPELLIGIANHYDSLERYNADAAYGIKIYLTEETRKQHMSLLSRDKVYSDTYMTRPYVIYKDVFTDAPGERFRQLKRIWEGKHIIIVEGAETRLGVGNDLFDNAVSLRRILAPATSSFDRYDDVLAKCEECHSTADLFLLAIGPSSGVLAYDLSKQGIQAVDVGHIDLEYEWFLAGKGVRVAVPGKYNNEVVGGDEVCNEDLPEKYCREIIADFSEGINTDAKG